MTEAPTKQFVVCLDNAAYPASLERLKIYVALPDAEAEALGMTRVIDELGEDYLYPKTLFSTIELSPALSKAILAVA